MVYRVRRDSSGKFRKSYTPIVAAGLGAGLKAVSKIARNYLGKKVSATITQAVKRTRNGRTTKQTGASYRGRFTNRRFPRKRAGAAAKGENYYARYGTTDTLEVSGVVSDPNCVYLGHSSFSATRILQSAVQAILRKLYIAAIGFDVSSISETIPYTNGNSGGHSVHLWSRIGNTGGSQTEYHAIADGVSISAISAFSHPVGAWFQGLLDLDRQAMRISIMDNTTNLVRATLDLTKCTLDYYFKSEMKIQNVTISATGSDEADDVNNVPLVGRSYEFKTWSPSFNQTLSAGNILNAVPVLTGVNVRRAGEFESAMSGMREPPPSKVFMGVVKTDKVRLQPGTIKSDWLIGSGKITLDRFIGGLQTIPGHSFNRRVMFGRHSMVALEKVIGIAGTLPIKVYYEVNHFIGISAKCGFTHAVVGTHGTTTQDNLAP